MTNNQLLAIFVISCWFLSTPVTSLLVETITWNLYYKNGTSTQVKYDQADQLIPHMDLQVKTLIYCHGYTESTDQPGVKGVIDGFLAGSDYNIIAIDYSYITHTDYLTAASLADDVAAVIVRGINAMVTVGLDKKDVICSGFSLGAQICAFVGRQLPFPLPKIIAVDPAGPLFNFTSPSLTASDADCVISIHADMGFYGTTQPCNHIDFYINSGKQQQPGCTVLTPGPLPNACSHLVGEKCITEAARNPQAIIGIKCNSWEDFKAGKCNQNDTIPLGIDTPCSASGFYFFQTNSESPYARGIAGTVYQVPSK